MNFKNIHDLAKIDADLAGLFLCSDDEVINFIYNVEHGIKEWVAKHNKQHWEVVRYVCIKKGILGKRRKNGKIMLTRINFASLLCTFCPNAFKDDENPNKLKSSIESYEYACEINSLINKEGYKSIHVDLNHRIEEVEHLLEGKPIFKPQEEKIQPTLDILLHNYVSKVVDEQTKEYYKQEIYHHRTYTGGMKPALSVEKFKNKQLYEEHRPSLIIMFEIVDEKVTVDKIYELAGRYGPHNNVKLFVVSYFGLDNEVRKIAEDKGIGYVLVNRNRDITNENFILPRSIEDYTKRQYYLDMLSGKKSIDTPFLLMFEGTITPFFPEVLKKSGLAVNDSSQLHVPYISDDDIEQRVTYMTTNVVNVKVIQFVDFNLHIENTIDNRHFENLDLSINPMFFALLYGVKMHERQLENELQLGIYNVIDNSIVLNSSIKDEHRLRFTAGHELGHALLHSKLFKEQYIVSVGETQDTLIDSKTEEQRLEYQANYFASCLLMPKNLVSVLYDRLYTNYVTRKYGKKLAPIYYSPNQPETWDIYNEIVIRMASILNVSKRAMEIRLKRLKLLTMHDEDNCISNFFLRI